MANREIKKLELALDQVTQTKSILSYQQVQRLWNSTKARYVYTRPAKGGGTWDYVKASYVRKVLDSVFGFNWDFEIETSLAEAFEVASKTGTCVVKGTLKCRTEVEGQWITISKTQFGRADVQFKKGTKEPLDFGNSMKASATDCFKKCASYFGVAQDIYEADEFIEIQITDPKDQAKQKTINKLIEASKKKIEGQENEAKN